MKFRLSGIVLAIGIAAGQAAPANKQPIDFALRTGRPVTSRAVQKLCGAPECRNLAFRIDAAKLLGALKNAPGEASGSKDAPVIALPMPDGSTARLAIYESSILSPEMAIRYPELKTYRGRQLDDPSSIAALDYTPSGLHVMLLSGSGTTMIDPVEDGVYISYNPAGSPGAVECALDAGRLAGVAKKGAKLAEGNAAVDLKLPTALTSLRIFRAAVVASSSYAASQGGTEYGVTASITSQMNRVNAIFERDASMRLQLIDTVVYTTPASQPFSVESEMASVPMATAAHDILTRRLGTNFDVGHMFTGDGGGGVALGLGIVCNNENKGGGSSLGINGVTPLHWINLVAHEFGHQLGAEHTFNAQEVAGCKTGNRNGPTAFEPGSGSTTMSYVGLCSTKDEIQDLQGSEDLIFHGYSIKEMLDFVNTGGGKASGTCGVPTLATRTNALPVISGAGNFTIPAQTPFILDASATDSDDAAANLTYVWDGIDIGAPNAPNDDDGTRPLFRSYLPQSSGRRYFPSLRYILNNGNVPPATYTAPYGPPADGGVSGETKDFRVGEVLPATDRTLRFRMTVRDNRASDGTVGGGVAFADSTVKVVGGAGPFRVTAPNGGESLTAGSQATVTWDVAKTDAAPIGTTQVRILLSVDGGLSFSISLAEAVPNNGSATVTIPAGTSTTQARIEVAAAGSIYFDVSDANFTIR